MVLPRQFLPPLLASISTVRQRSWKTTKSDLLSCTLNVVGGDARTSDHHRSVAGRVWVRNHFLLLLLQGNTGTAEEANKRGPIVSRTPLAANHFCPTSPQDVNMPLAKRFKLSLASCWGSGATTYGDSKDVETEPKAEEEPKPKPYDFTQHPEHADWSHAVAAAAAIKHLPSPEDALIPWSHIGSVAGDAEVCTLKPVSGEGRATLFLRTTFTASVLAKRLKNDFAEFSNLTIKVSRCQNQLDTCEHVEGK